MNLDRPRDDRPRRPQYDDEPNRLDGVASSCDRVPLTIGYLIALLLEMSLQSLRNRRDFGPMSINQ